MRKSNETCTTDLPLKLLFRCLDTTGSKLVFQWGLQKRCSHEKLIVFLLFLHFIILLQQLRLSCVRREIQSQKLQMDHQRLLQYDLYDLCFSNLICHLLHKSLWDKFDQIIFSYIPKVFQGLHNRKTYAIYHKKQLLCHLYVLFLRFS